MKIFTILITLMSCLFSMHLFSQENNKSNLRSENILSEQSILKSVSTAQRKNLNLTKDRELKTVSKETISDDGFLLSEIIGRYWSGINWVNEIKTTNSYDGNNNPVERVTTIYQMPNWINTQRESNIFDVNNNMIESQLQIWDGTQWVNQAKFTYSYQGNNKLIEQLEQTWDGNDWINESKWTYSYGTNDDVVESLCQIWDNSIWINDLKWTYSYDGNNNRIEEFGQSWGGVSWTNYYKLEFVYDENDNVMEGLEQSWTGFYWVNEWNGFFTYNEDHYCTEVIWKKWDGLMWKNCNRELFTYDGNNNKTEELWQTWENSSWADSYKYFLSYLPATHIDPGIELTNGYVLYNNYPNPFNPSTTIAFELPTTGKVTLKIFNILGEEISTLVSDRLSAGSYSYEWSRPDGIPSGVYFYRLEAAGYVRTRKMVLMR